MRLRSTYSTLNSTPYQVSDREFVAMGVEYLCIGSTKGNSGDAWLPKPINSIANYQYDCLHRQNFKEPQLTRTRGGYKLRLT